MQAGHVALAATIASFTPEITGAAGTPEMQALSISSLAVAFISHWLPNMDVIPIKLGWAKDSFHCTWSHSLIFFAFVFLALWIPGILWFPIMKSWAVVTIVSLLLHILGDMPSSVGLPILMPLKKRFTLNLWADTGHSGWFAFMSTYQQAWTWIIEGSMFLILFVRLYQLQMWIF